jgi:hypothetical protein
MSLRAPKLPPAPAAPPNAEDEAARMAREAEVRRTGRGKRAVSLTALGNAIPTMPGGNAISMLPGRASVTGG